MTAKHAGRRGRPWRRLRAEAIATYGPLCWICGRHIDLSLPRNHPRSYDADHLDPLALGGAPLDLARIRPAHAHCNRSRGAAAAQTVFRNSEDW